MKIADLTVGETYVHLRGSTHSYVSDRYRLLSKQKFDKSKGYRATQQPVTLPDGKVVQVFGAYAPLAGRSGTHVVVQHVDVDGKDLKDRAPVLVTPSTLAMTMTEWAEVEARREVVRRESAEHKTEQTRILNAKSVEAEAALRDLGLDDVEFQITTYGRVTLSIDDLLRVLNRTKGA